MGKTIVQRAPLSFLIIEDEPHYVRLVRELLDSDEFQQVIGFSFEVLHADEVSKGLSILAQQEVDIILLDLNLPDGSGFTTFETVRARVPAIPIIVWTALNDESIAIKTLQHGAQDYLIKGDLEKRTLFRSIIYALERHRVQLRRSYQELQLTEARLRRVIEKNADAIVIVGHNGKIRFANPAAERIFGCNSSELINTTFEFPLISGESTEIRIVPKIGRIIVAEIRVVEIMWEGRPGSLASLRDITQRKQTENQLKRLNRALKTVSECNAILVRAKQETELLDNVCQVIINQGGYPLVWVGCVEENASGSIKVAALAGENLKYLENSNFHWRGLRHDSEPTEIAIYRGEPCMANNILDESSDSPWQQRAIKQGYLSCLALPLISGQKILGSLTIYANRAHAFDQGEIALLNELAQDLSYGISALRSAAEREKAEQKAAEQAALLNETREAIMVLDLENQIQFWNRGAEKLYGFTAEEAYGKNSADLLFKGNSKLFTEARKSVIQKGQWSGIFHHFVNTGQEIIIESRWSLIKDDQNNPKSFLVIHTDITEQRKLETQFLRAQRLENMGTLAGGIAHDLNNILAPILMGVQLLKSELTEAERLKILLMVETGARRGAGMVQQVLTFARGVEGKRILIQPSQLILEMDGIIKATFPKSIELHTDIPESLWNIWGDSTQLNQVLMNLCVNARDAMPQGGNLEISVKNTLLTQSYAKMYPDAKAGPYIMMTVSDTGTGIPSKLLSKIFEPFFSTKEPGKGTGLGLSTVAAIVKSHGGFLDLKSHPGKGTIFQIYIPALAESAKEAAVEMKEIPEGKGELILLVDDEAAIRDITKTSLETYGYRVLIADEGTGALALAAQHSDKIHAVLLDMMMPIMDGAATIKALKKLNPKFRIVATSGLVDGNKHLILEKGNVCAYLNKPYTIEQLLKTLREVLES